MDQPNVGLRARLVATGVELVAGQGAEGLSLREIARRAGVSHGAPRRHFPTHQALLAAIAREGYRELGRQADEVLADSDRDPYDLLLALSRRYLEFAHGNRGMFELMFRHDLLRGNQMGLRAASVPLFEVLVDLVARARPAPPGGSPAAVVAGALWANLHGLAQLRLWGSLQLMTGVDEAEPLLRAALDAHLGSAGH
ncbi:TetR/AcrR family transcriptional regulator [Micromonospora narathiwatensis]|uniref:Transcriptional regulator, TetR family n=1 Tax=Micromonospora narathiwatensis TaxID=299146 RepID=A0A1A8ZWN4_9ACTN|nr:TetR/AcrR family transcriptional regulator [Micromonospora narathiwatensis]SBT48327.1 transcriptional regulator, TetR family [Micromonospora narathiwatensis]